MIVGDPPADSKRRTHDTRLDTIRDARSGTTGLRYCWYLGHYDTRHLRGGDMFVMHFVRTR